MLHKKRKASKILIFVLIILVLGILLLLISNIYVNKVGSKYILSESDVTKADAIIILGAYVFPDGSVSEMLKDRLDMGLKLFKEGKAPKIIVSGDHGQTTYDEVNNMRKYLQERGVKREDIFMDHAGFNTYDSIYRAIDIFEVKNAIIVTQEFHLIRSLYIAKELGLNAYGVKADTRVYPGIIYNNGRELGSRFKAFMQAGIFHPKPKYLGSVIPVSGDGSLTDDGK